MPKIRNYFLFFLKFLVSFSILAFLLLYKTSVREIIYVLREASIFWLVLSFSLHSLGLLISAVRWQILIRAQGDQVPLGFLAKSYLVGSFFNNFLPTRFGGDVVRIWDGSRYSKSLLKSSAIVLVERLTGIIVLFLFAFSASLFRLDMAEKVPVIWVSLLLGSVGIAALLFFFTPLARKILQKMPEAGFFVKVKSKTLLFRETVLHYRTQKPAFLKALFWAFLLQINVIFHYILIGKALGLSIHMLDYFVFVPIVLLIMTIPVTINGLGLREGSYIEIFKFYQILPQAAFSFSFIDMAFGLIVGIVGGIIYVLRK